MVQKAGTDGALGKRKSDWLLLGMDIGYGSLQKPWIFHFFDSGMNINPRNFGNRRVPGICTSVD
jgi:hypothetical protein